MATVFGAGTSGTTATTGVFEPVIAIDPAGIPTAPPPVKEKKPDKVIIPHSVVCDGNTRCDKCRRLGCVGNCVPHIDRYLMV